MSNRQGNLKDYQGNKIVPNTSSVAVLDEARSQALSYSLTVLVENGALGFPTFTTVSAYSEGDQVYYDRKLWEFTADKAAGAWDATKVAEFSLKQYADALKAAGDAALAAYIAQADEQFAQKTGYYQGMAVGLADNIRGDVTSTEQFRVRPTGGAGNEVGQIGVLKQVQGAGFSSAQLYPEGSDHTFSADVDITDAPLRYIDRDGTTEQGYLMCMECFVGKVFDQTALDAVSAKDAEKAAGDKCVWLTPVGGVTTAPTIAEGEESVTFSGWRIAMRVKASEVRDHTAAAYWFTDGSVGRQCKDVVVAVGIDQYRLNPGITPAEYDFILADGWNTKSAMEWLLLEAQNGLPTVQRKAEQKLLGVTKFGFRTVKSRNLLNPATGKAFVCAYTNDEEGFLDNQCTVIGGLPSGTTLSFQSLLTGQTEAITVDSNNRFTVPCSGWVIVSGTLPSAIILTWNGKYDSAPADTYETESHSWVVSGLKGKLNGEGEMVQIGTMLRGAGSDRDLLSMVNAEIDVKVGDVDLGTLSYVVDTSTITGVTLFRLNPNINRPINSALLTKYAFCTSRSVAAKSDGVIVQYNTSNNRQLYIRDDSHQDAPSAQDNWLSGVHLYHKLYTPLHYTSLTYTDPETGIETALAELQFADNNWSIEETIYDEPTTDANDVQTPVGLTPVLTSEYSMDAAELLDTLSVEYSALEARVAALEAIINA